MDAVYLIQNLLSLHSTQCSMDSRDFKDGLCLAIFGLADSLMMNETEFEKHIFTENDGYLYCYSEENLEKLNLLTNKEHIFLCCSKPDGFFNHTALPFNNYKYYYKIKLKNNTFGIDVNSFFEGDNIISKKNLNEKLYFNNGNYHPQEKEVIVKLKDIEFERIK